ncbi:helix-turn-helix domain-containing protein [Phenylobacterium sp. LjRoot225]|uniref:helix-turn-helix domain-containing protein n=1 Tax=Phenylobacterium sp. LjRoot225 TaxID=3342285 RepID=UPI003ED061DC
MSTSLAIELESPGARIRRPTPMTLADLNHARPSELLAYLKREVADLTAYCATLKEALCAAGLPFTPARHPLLAKLKPQEAALVGILFSAYPNVLHRYDILEALPGRDQVDERVASLVGCKVAHVRKVLGPDAIENVRGEGYRLGAAFHAELAATGDVEGQA